MNYKNTNTLMSSKKFEAAKIRGLLSGITLKFKTIRVRVYQSEGSHDLFFCTIAIPTLSDHSGYVLELEPTDYFQKEPETSSTPDRFIERQYDPEEDSMVNMCEFDSDNDEFIANFDGEYNASSNGIDFSELAKSSKLNFEEISEEGRKILLLVLKVSGTPYYGKALIDPDFYVHQS